MWKHLFIILLVALTVSVGYAHAVQAGGSVREPAVASTLSLGAIPQSCEGGKGMNRMLERHTGGWLGGMVPLRCGQPVLQGTDWPENCSASRSDRLSKVRHTSLPAVRRHQSQTQPSIIVPV